MLKAEGIIQMRVAQQYHTLLSFKLAGKMWRTLRTKFQDIASMSIIDILYNTSFKRMTEYKSAVKYCAEYENALNSIKAMIEENSELSKRGAEQVLQGYLLRNVSDVYLPLIAQLHRDWLTGKANLTVACRAITSYSVNIFDKKAFHINVSSVNDKTPPGTCTFSECICKRTTAHTPERRWQKYPEKRPKFPLKSMKTSGTQTCFKN